MNHGTGFIQRKPPQKKTKKQPLDPLLLDAAASADQRGSCMVQPGTAWYRMVQPYIAWFSLVPHGTAWFSLVSLFFSAWYRMVRSHRSAVAASEHWPAPQLRCSDNDLMTHWSAVTVD
jgi:hypothetical protein